MVSWVCQGSIVATRLTVLGCVTLFSWSTGDGPIRGIVAIASGAGSVRGYVGSPMLGDIGLQEALGKGSVQIVKNHPDWPRPYNGITAIRHGKLVVVFVLEQFTKPFLIPCAAVY